MQPVRGLPLVLSEGLSVALTPPALKRDRWCTVERASTSGDGALVSFSGIDSMTDAEAISGCYVLACEDDLELGPLDASVEELSGRTVVDERFGVLGVVRDILELPANDVWVVDGGSYGEVLIPVVEDVIPQIPDSGNIAVHVMDGLIETNDSEVS